MKVKVIKRYNDVVLKKIQKVNTILDVDEKRAKHLVEQGVAVYTEKETEGKENKGEK